MLPDLEKDFQFLGKFFDFIYANETGYVNVALKPVNKPQRALAPVGSDWIQKFFAWPEQKELLVATVLAEAPNNEVYYTPAILNRRSTKKDAVAFSRVLWVDFDGNAPTELYGVPEPSLKIRSSLEGREHWYWKLEASVEPQELERLNRTLAYALGCDISGWDAGQVLRPPFTFNHKRQKPVTIESRTGSLYTGREFGALPNPPERAEIELPDSIPDPQRVLDRYRLPEQVLGLFREGRPDVLNSRGEPEKSNSLMMLGYDLAENGLADGEILSLLLNADARWGKFSGRTDQMRRLMEIVGVARAKYPYKEPESVLIPEFGFKSFLATEIHIDWLLEGWLQTKGRMLLTGPPGIGKTQFAISAASHIALGKDFIGLRTARPGRVAFLSLEMGHADLKVFTSLQAAGFTPEELDVLEDRLILLPVGEALHFTRTEVTDWLTDFIQRSKIDGLIVDSLSSFLPNMSDEAAVNKFNEWDSRLRNRLGCFTWYIHHHRKAQGDNQKPNKLGDVYGSVYLTGQSTTVASLWRTSLEDTLEVTTLKLRLAKEPKPFQIVRSSNLHFSKFGQEQKTPKPEVKPEPPSLQTLAAKLIVPPQTQGIGDLRI